MIQIKSYIKYTVSICPSKPILSPPPPGPVQGEANLDELQPQTPLSGGFQLGLTQKAPARG